MIDLKAMGKRLKVARETAGLTQQVAAFRSQIDASSLSRYERGLVRDASIETVKKLADLYNARIDWIVNGAGPMTLSLVESQVDRDDEAVEALRLFLAGFEPDDPHAPTPDEAKRLKGLSFRELRLVGFDVTPSLFGRLLREWRLQAEGRAARGEPEQVAVDDSTMDYPITPPRGRS